MHADIAEKRQDLIALCRRYGVLRLEIFGSAARATDFDPKTSDADFLVEFDRDGSNSPLAQYFGFADALEKMLGRSVDLVERGAVANPFIQASIDQSRELVYAA
jgi:predicted nucleotidyltransferase